MQAIEFNRDNHPKLNQIYDMLAKLKNEGKNITLCEVYAHIEFKCKEAADKI